MTTNTKTRQQLKAYFVKNAIPSEDNFEDLIDAPLNQRDDGVFRRPGEALGVFAEAEPQRRALRFFPAGALNPDWIVSLSPAQNPADLATARPGLGLTDAAGVPRLFLDLATGHLGLGTNDPGASRLHVVGDARVTGGLSVSGALSISGPASLAALQVTGPLTLTGPLNLTGALSAAGPLSASAGASVTGNLGVTGRLGVGTLAPQGELEVITGGNGLDRLLLRRLSHWDGVSTHATISGCMYLDPHVPWSSGESRASIRYGLSGGAAPGVFWDVGVRPGNAFSFAVNGATHQVWLHASGNVGIGTDNPGTNRLQVEGNTRVSGALTVTGATSLAALATVGPLTVGTAQAPQPLTVTGATTLAALSTSGTVSVGGHFVVPAGNVGIGTNNSGINRLQVEGLTRINGNLGLGGDAGQNRLHVEGNALVTGALTANTSVNVGPAANIDFGAQPRQLLNLFNAEHGVGVQNFGVLYLRTAKHLALFQGGTHDSSAFSPGVGGAVPLVVRDGNVGLGTSDPGVNRLQVEGNTRLSGALTVTGAANLTSLTTSGPLNAGATVTAGANLLVPTGSVGIGTANPGVNRLQVDGTTQIGGALNALGALNASGLVTAGAGLVVPSGNVGIGTVSPGLNRLQVEGLTRINGNLGLGADPGTSRLHVEGSARVTGLLSVAGLGTDGGLAVNAGALTYFGPLRQMINLAGVGTGLGAQANTLYLRTGSNFAFYQNGTHDDAELSPGAGGTAVLVVRGGNVGIGTASPGARLQVAGTAAVTGALTASGGLSVSGGALVVPAGSVGIGTASPTSSLHVEGTTLLSGLVTLGSGLTIANSNALSFTGATSQRINLNGAAYGIGLQASTLYLRSFRNFALYQGGVHDNTDLSPGAGGTAAVVVDNGNVGIGTPPGASRLAVAGNTQISGGITATGVVNAGALVTTGIVTAGSLLTASQDLQVVGAAAVAGPVTLSNVLTLGNAIVVPSTGGTILSGRRGLILNRNQQLQQHVVLPTIPATVNFATGVTIQAWVYINNFAEWARIVDLGNGPSSDNIAISIGANGSLRAVVYQGTNAGNWVGASPPATLPLRVWTHVAVTIGPVGGARMFVNGTRLTGLGTPFSVLTPLAVNRTSNLVGRSNWGLQDPHLDGSIAELSIWVGERPIVMTPLVGNEAGLVGYWKLDQNATPVVAPTGTTTLVGSPLPDFGPSYGADMRWCLPDFRPNWFNYESGFPLAAYCRDALGYVHLRGLVRENPPAVRAAGNSTVIFTLPPSYRPQAQSIFAVDGTNAHARLDVAPNGDVVLVGGSTTHVTLDGITFQAAF